MTLEAPESPTDLEAFRRLEAEVVALRNRVGELEKQRMSAFGLDFSNVEQIERNLRQRHLELSAVSDRDRLAALIDDRLSYLERFPDRPDAEEQLKGLLDNCISIGDTEAGLQHLSRFAGPVGMDARAVLQRRGSLLLAGKRYEEAKSDYRALANDGSAPEHMQASGAFMAAYIEKQYGNPEIAKQAFEDLIARFGQSEDWQTLNSVGGAEIQLNGSEYDE
jgi:CRISPR/Cas system Type II protein with McrA/HNH and RuvC-like nuclease domain